MEIRSQIPLSDKQKQDLQEGATWLQDWLTKRQKEGRFVDRVDSDYSDEDRENDAPDGKIKYSEAMDKLKNVTICVIDPQEGETAQECHDKYIRQLLKEGKLHLTEEALAQYDGDINRAIEEYSATTNCGENFVGVYNPDIAEPTVFITKQALDENMTASVIAHECTHLIGLSDSEIQITPITDNINYVFESKNSEFLQNPEAQYDSYWDSGKEIYARLMQLRHDMGIDPNKTWTKEDVAKMREETKKRTDEYKKKLGLDPNKKYTITEIKVAQAVHPEAGPMPTAIDQNMFSRYTDEQIAFFLNETSHVELKNDMSKDAKETHNKAQNITIPTDMRDVRTAMREDALFAHNGNQSQTEKTNQTTLTPEMIARRNSNQYA